MSPAVAAGRNPAGSPGPSRATSLAWKIVPSPNPPSNGAGNVLYDVACPAADDCIAVGGSAPGNLAQRWNGTAWTLMATPQVATPAWLEGVTCLSAQACTAVGAQGSGSGLAVQTLVETWNGTKWAVVPSPDVASKDNALAGVSCVSAQACMAVGSVQPDSPVQHSKTLIESWNGTAWKIVPGAQLPPKTYDALASVSCVSAQDCTAVGEQGNGDQPLIESWNGTAWKVVPAATKPGQVGSHLASVVCLSATACTAVGTIIDSNLIKTLVESWNGTAWKIVPSPSLGHTLDASSMLDSVSCLSARACTAVGTHDVLYQGHAEGRTLAESWNGTAWTLVPSPNRGTGANESYLLGVSCASASFCSAVGWSSGTPAKTLIELGTPAA